MKKRKAILDCDIRVSLQVTSKGAWYGHLEVLDPHGSITEARVANMPELPRLLEEGS